MEFRVRAERSKLLMESEHFQFVMKDLRERQMAIFASSAASEVEKRENAHAILRALNEIEGVLQADVDAVKLQNKKDRDRGSD
jgi:hypothetical protein